MKKRKCKSFYILSVLLLLPLFTAAAWSETGFTEKDRQLMVELKTKMDGIDKQFEQVDKRFGELREDMNKRFEQVDKRFEQVDKRFEQMMSFVWILAVILGAMVSVTIGFAVWDRRTMVRPFETTVSEMDKRITLNRKDYETLISVLKEYSKKNKSFANIIQQFHLF